VIHGEDAALLAELAVHRKLAKLGLRQLAPTVLISRTPLAKTLAALRAEGYAPVAEAADGAVRIEKVERRRAAPQVPTPRRAPSSAGVRLPSGAARQVSGADCLRDLAVRLCAAPPSSPEPDPDNGVPFETDTEEIIAGYADRLSLADVRQDERVFTLSRIASVMPVPTL
jgi:hypothetical protein